MTTATGVIDDSWIAERILHFGGLVPRASKAPEEPEGERATRAARPGAADDAEEQERATAALVASAIATSGPLFERRVSALVDEFLKANPDPFV